MLLYWILLLIPALGAVFASNQMRQFSNVVNKKHYRTQKSSLPISFFAFLMVLVVGLRHEVGADWSQYVVHVERAFQLTWIEAIMQIKGEPAYGLLTWIAAQLGGGVYLVNFVSAAIFVAGLMVFARNSPFFWLTLCVAVPYLVIVVAMGYTRQSAAIGLVMIGLVSLSRGQLYKFTAWLILAALFHKSAVILIPLAVFSGRRKWGAVLGVLLVGGLMFALILAEHIDFLYRGYMFAKYESSGAAIRVSMNALPAAVFLLFRHRFGLTIEQNAFWTWMSLGALAFIVLLAVSPSSTAVDRLALYWIPLQLFVWSRLPQAMGQRAGTKRQWLAVVMSYAFAVQFVWLLYADHSYAWLPYQFYPWVWLWS